MRSAGNGADLIPVGLTPRNAAFDPPYASWAPAMPVDLATLRSPFGVGWVEHRFAM